MRTFVLYSRGRTDSRFKLEDLPSSGRMDLICRCITSVLFLSYKMRKNTRIFVVLNGPPKPPVTICFNENSSFCPDERSIALIIKKILSLKLDKEWKKFKNSLVSKKSFQEVIGELNGNFYVLHEKGKDVNEIKENPIFVLGDNKGIPKNDEKFVLRKGEKISLGKQSYLSSMCVSVLNWVCDREGIS